MAEGYHTNNKKTPQGVTNVEVILFDHLMQKKRWKEQTEQWKEQTEQWKEQIEQWKRANRAMERILFHLKWQTKGSTT
jgi:gas vesicle protein